MLIYCITKLFNLILFYFIFWWMQPAKRHAYAQAGDSVFMPVERELIFDIVSCSVLNISKLKFKAI